MNVFMILTLFFVIYILIHIFNSTHAKAMT